MRTIVSIVEGYGDHAAVPHLIAKMGEHFQIATISPNPIRAGKWKKIRRPGELERNLDLAFSRKPDGILIILDLEDDCPVKEAEAARVRIDAWLNGRACLVSVVFLVKEYEALFLACARVYTDDKVLAKKKEEVAETVRDAKGHVREIIGRRYKEVVDQADLTKKMSIEVLLSNSRSSRKLAKDLFG